MDLFFASLYKYKILSLWEETSIVKMHSHLVLWMVHGEWSWTKRWDENNIDESFCQAVAASSCFIGFVREVVPHDMFLWWHGEKCGIAHRSTWEKNDDVTVTSNAFETFETDLPKFSISKILSHNSSPETFAIWGGGVSWTKSSSELLSHVIILHIAFNDIMQQFIYRISFCTDPLLLKVKIGD